MLTAFYFSTITVATYVIHTAHTLLTLRCALPARHITSLNTENNKNTLKQKD